MNNALAGQLPEELSDSLSLNASFRAKQIFRWIHSGASDFNAMTNLPKDLRNTLHQRFPSILESSVHSRRTDPDDGSVKLTIRLKDGLFAESVLLIDGRGRKTACLSSQVGCAMGCLFCRTGTMGFLRNLSASEIIEQLLMLKASYGDITHIVFMGMGEPLANREAVMKAAQLLHHPEAHNISYRRITLSTCGLADQIRTLHQDPPIRLAVSLVTAREDLRNTLMPVNRRYPLRELRSSLLAYQRASGRRITLEYVLIRNCNDTPEDIAALAGFCKGLKVLVNVIPWNPVEGLSYQEPSPAGTEKFSAALEQLGITVSKRLRKGRGVNGACGQLAVPLNPASEPHESS